MFRKIYLACGVASLLLGAFGVLLPLLPTVPFVILAAYCFGRSDPRIESRLLRHPRFGPAILQWRVRGAIARKGKIAATLAFVVSIALALIVAPLPWALIPVAAALIAGGWIWSRPDA
ncbi:MAG: YbaN family protein [Phenylobacterium sp.]|nr:YbaN family protein [Phenylobacterium sp.]